MELKRLIYILLTCSIFSACVKEATDEVETISIIVSGDVLWENKDAVWIFDAKGDAYKFVTSDPDASKAEFKCSNWPAGQIPQFALFNPKYGKAQIVNGLIQALIHSEQAPPEPESFAKYANLSVGKVECVSDVYQVNMQNVCAFLRVNLLDNGISQVTITGNDGENLSGIIMVDYNDGNPSYSFGHAVSDEMVLIPAMDSQIGEYLKGVYYICIPPQKFEKGITISVINHEGKSGELRIDTPLDLQRGQIVDLGDIDSSIVDFGQLDITSPMDMDFSRIGYHYSEDDFPQYDANVIYLEPVGNGSSLQTDQIVDRTDDINNAIQNVGKPGTVILKAGRYYVSKQILLNSSGVVLRGEVSESASNPKERNLATIIGTMQDDSHPSLVVFGNSKSEPVKGDCERITASRIPEGAMFVVVENPGEFSVGETILVSRPDNELWQHDLGMDAILSKDGTQTYSWTDYGHTFEINAERIITSIDGNRLYLDAPLPMAIESKYGGGYVHHCTFTGKRVSESGLEYINLDNLYDKSVVSANYGGKIYLTTYQADEKHYWNAVRFFGAEHCWVKGVTGSHFAFSTVSVYGCSKNLTVEDCHSYEPVSLITGSRRYAFTIARGQLCLFKGCTAEKDRHEFVTTGIYAVGPNAYVDCIGKESYSNAGPHSHWATCILYDNVKTEQLLSVEDAQYLGYASGAQGWQGANHVFWNCEAPEIVCQSPQVSARNWAWGCIGEKLWGSLERTANEGARKDGEWHSHGAHVTPSSLYEHQLDQRLSSGIRIMDIIK